MWLLREEEKDEWTRVGQLLGGKHMRSWRAAEALRDTRVVCALYVDLTSTSASVEKPLNNNEDQRFSDMCVWTCRRSPGSRRWPRPATTHDSAPVPWRSNPACQTPNGPTELPALTARPQSSLSADKFLHGVSPSPSTQRRAPPRRLCGPPGVLLSNRLAGWRGAKARGVRQPHLFYPSC